MPRREILRTVCAAAAMTAAGENTLHSDTIEGLLPRVPESEEIEWRATNNHILRAMVDCIVKGDEVSPLATHTLAGLSHAVHRNHAPSELFVLLNLSQAKEPGLVALREDLTGVSRDPVEALVRLRENLRYSRLKPERLGAKHEFVEDALARAAAFCYYNFPDSPQLYKFFAKMALAFRTTAPGVLPEQYLNDCRKGEMREMVDRVRKGIVATVALSREVLRLATQREESNDLRALVPLTRSLEELLIIITAREPWRPLSFFDRADLIGHLQQFTDENLQRSFRKFIGIVFDEMTMLLKSVDSPSISSAYELAHASAFVAQCDPVEPFLPNASDYDHPPIFPGTHGMLRELRKLYRKPS